MLRPARSQKFRFEYIPIKFEATATLTRNIDLQRPALSRRHPDQHDARLEGVPLRVRVRLRHQEPRLRRLRHRSEVHRCGGSAEQPGVERVRERARADSRRSAASAASTSCRTSRSPARSPASSCPTASTAATAGTTWTSTSTARSTSRTTSACKGGFRSLDMGYLVKQDSGQLHAEGDLLRRRRSVLKTRSDTHEGHRGHKGKG